MRINHEKSIKDAYTIPRHILENELKNFPKKTILETAYHFKTAVKQSNKTTIALSDPFVETLSINIQQCHSDNAISYKHLRIIEAADSDLSE